CVVYGANFELTCDRQRLRAGTTFTLRADEVLRIGGARAGMRAYLCVRGGFQAAEILASRSALQPLKAGDLLNCSPGKIPARFLQWQWAGPRDRAILRALPGPQGDCTD